MEQFYQGAQVPYMPKEKVKVLRAGIGLFELRTLFTEYFDKTVMGPYNVAVTEFGEPGRRRQIKANWITDTSAGIRYVSDEEGNCIAWMPDDPWWHNRIQLMCNPFLNAVARHSPQEGIVGPQVINAEITAIRNMLMAETRIWKVVKNGDMRGISSYHDKKEAEHEIETLHHVALQVNTQNGTMRAFDRNPSKYEVKEDVHVEFRPEIKALIKAGRGLQYGWTSAPEFTTIWKPKIIGEYGRIKAQFMTAKVVPGSLTPADLVASVSAWSPEDKKKFRELMGQKTEPEPEVEKEESTPADPALPVGPFTREQLKTLEPAQLIQIARAKGLKLPKLTPFAVTEAIMASQETPGEDVE